MKMAEQISGVDIAIGKLSEIQEDLAVPKNVRLQIHGIISTLKDHIEMPIKVNKALNGLGELSNDVNLQAYTRTQIWDIMSSLEKI